METFEREMNPKSDKSRCILFMFCCFIQLDTLYPTPLGVSWLVFVQYKSLKLFLYLHGINKRILKHSIREMCTVQLEKTVRWSRTTPIQYWCAKSIHQQQKNYHNAFVFFTKMTTVSLSKHHVRKGRKPLCNYKVNEVHKTKHSKNFYYSSW